MSKEMLIYHITDLIDQARSVSSELMPKILDAMDVWWENLTAVQKCVVIQQCVMVRKNNVVGIYNLATSDKRQIYKLAGVKSFYGDIAILKNLRDEYYRMMKDTPVEMKREISPKLSELDKVLVVQDDNVSKSLRQKLDRLIMKQLSK